MVRPIPFRRRWKRCSGTRRRSREAAAGRFAAVLEWVPRGTAGEMTEELPVPTIGTGAGPPCDGQVLVFHDVVGLPRDLRPRFVRRYADLSSAIRDAATAYAKDVREG